MTKKTQEFNFTKSLQRLEEIVSSLEKPDLELEQSLKLLEEGVLLHKLCKEKLTLANIKVKSILEDGDEQNKA